MLPNKENILVILKSLKYNHCNDLKQIGLCGAYANDKDSLFIDVCFEFSDNLNAKIHNNDENSLYFWDILNDIQNEVKSVFKKDVNLIQLSTIDESTKFLLEDAVYV